MRAKEFITEASKQRLDAKCWKGKHKEGTKIKGGVRVNNCVPNESVEQGVAEGSTTRGGFGGSASQAYHEIEWLKKKIASLPPTKEKQIRDLQRQIRERELAIAFQKEGVAEDLDAQFDAIEEMVEAFAQHHGVDADEIWEDFESVSDEELLAETAAWQKSSGKNKNGGLNAKGVASYRAEHPGSKLQTAVTTKPSKLKKGSKAAKRRKSFCARMKGMKKHRTSSKTAHDPNSRINKSLRKWNC